MKIAVVGTGYVGLVTGSCLADAGMDVTCVDVDAKKIANLHEGILPIYEPGLEDIVERNTKAGRLKFTTSLDEAVRVGHRIRSILANVTFKQGDHETGVTVSIGLDSATGFDGITAEEFIRRADQALLEAKRRGRNRVCLYDEMAGELSSNYQPRS